MSFTFAPGNDLTTVLFILVSSMFLMRESPINNVGLLVNASHAFRDNCVVSAAIYLVSCWLSLFSILH